MTAPLLSVAEETADGRHTRRGITLLSGFLGSGKTTLLRSALAEPGRKVPPLIILNDMAGNFADDLLLATDDRHAVVVSGGCVCCTRLDALIAVLEDHLNAPRVGSSPGQVVIEASGLSDPGPIAYAVATHPVLRHHYEVVRTLVTVDVLHGLETSKEQEIALRQLLAADEIIVTKADLADAADVDRVCIEVQALNPSAGVTVAVQGRLVREIPTYDSAAPRRAMPGLAAVESDVATVEITAGQPLDWQKFSVWLSLLLHRHGDKVLRAKGALEVDGVGRVSINAVRHVVYPPEHVAPTTRPGSRLVFIVRGIEPEVIRRSFDTFVAT